MGKIIPSTSVSSDKAVMSKRLNTLANIYLDRDASRSEQINTANAVVASNLAMLCAKRPDLRSYDECMNTTYDYFNVTSQKGVRPTISGIALAFGLSRSQFLEACESGQVVLKNAPHPIALPNEVWNLFVNLRDNYISMLEGFLESNVIHPSAGMFLLKNNSDYKDVVEKKVSVTNATIDLTALAEKYKQELSDFE